jgi:hypothetical protein
LGEREVVGIVTARVETQPCLPHGNAEGGILPMPQYFSTAAVEVIQDIHEVDIRIIRGIIGVKVLVYVAVSKVLCAHVVEMVGNLQFSPVCNDVVVAGTFDPGLQLVKLGEGIVLHGVASPGREVSFDIGPADGMWDIDGIDGVIFGGGLGECFKIVIGVFEDFPGQMPEKLEDTGVIPLVLAEGFIIHEEVDDKSAPINGINPGCEFFSADGPLAPGAVGEPEGDIIAETIVFQEELELPAAFWSIDEIRASVTEDVVCAFGEDGVKAAELLNDCRQVVVVDKLRVPEDAGFLVEQFSNGLSMSLYLLNELIAGIEEAETMVVGFGEKFHAAGFGQGLKTGENLGGTGLKLFE